MNRFFPIIVVLVTLTAPLLAETKISPKKDKAIRKLIQLTMENSFELSTFHRAFRKLIQKNKKLDAKQKASVLKTVDEKLGKKQLENLFVPVYAKHYNLKDIKGLIKFYQSPLGKKLRKTDAKIRRELHKVGGDYGQKIMSDIALQLQLQTAPRKPATSPKKR